MQQQETVSEYSNIVLEQCPENCKLYERLWDNPHSVSEHITWFKENSCCLKISAYLTIVLKATASVVNYTKGL